MALDEMTIVLPLKKILSMEPLHDNVLVEVKDERNIVNGIKMIITNDNPFVPEKGTVIALGKGINLISVGDVVYFEYYRGRFIKEQNGNRLFLLLNINFIIAIEEN